MMKKCNFFFNILLYFYIQILSILRVRGISGAMPQILCLYKLLNKQGHFIYKRIQSTITTCLHLMNEPKRNESEMSREDEILHQISR